MYINDSPARLEQVKKAIELMAFSDFEKLAELIEFSRSKGKNKSCAKITPKILHDAISMGALLNRIERQSSKLKCAGSSPAAPTKLSSK